jgi:hypothetical protein
MKRPEASRSQVRPLVLGHLERTGSDAFTDFPRQIADLVHGKHGVYALYKGDRLYYVGLARNLRNRVRHHRQDRHGGKWDNFSLYLVRKVEHIKEIESLVLRIANPKGNRSTGRLPGSKDLWKELDRDIEIAQELKRKELHADRTRPRRTRTPRRAATRSEGPALAAIANRPAVLHTNYKGRNRTARVRRDGAILFAGTVYNSPTMAAKAATGGHSRNGWNFWKYRNPAGNLVRLDTIRR